MLFRFQSTAKNFTEMSCIVDLENIKLEGIMVYKTNIKGTENYKIRFNFNNCNINEVHDDEQAAKSRISEFLTKLNFTQEEIDKNMSDLNFVE